MSGIFGSPKMPSIVTPARPAMPTPPPVSKPAVEDIKEKEKKKLKRGGTGRTIATGPRGVLTKAPVERKFLLGE